MRLRTATSGALAVLGGLLMLASGYASRGILFAALGYVGDEIPSYLVGSTESAAGFAVTALQLIIALGGLTALAGGAALLRHHRTIGRTLIFLGGGAGFLGVAISFAFAAYRLGLGPALGYAPYWAGLAMAAGARQLAKSG
ncbi:MAG: hypothetical protein HY297_02135 [Thaumarchaeota archaeon]|nr:hypothetical protein [Nitrososphaerota archaeon]